ncbi:jg14844 [Pararge aegeria aegeria]|uniref:Jg14844 protein n=1 Tax=Pararge aegeria aegeria TaxID=348720 RepID=A0A8S4QQ86_9NEOP|nr:jg14844 [Pararge aegeria aegeria]
MIRTTVAFTTIFIVKSTSSELSLIFIVYVYRVKIKLFCPPDWFPGWRKHAGQPNDDGTSGQDCVEARRELPPRPAHPTFMWNDRSCHEHNYYVCERPGVEGQFTTYNIT